MKHIFTILLLFAWSKSFAQISSDTIHWSTSFKLTWGDFTGSIDSNVNKNIGSVCKAFIHCDYHLDDNEVFHYNVVCYFKKSGSWVIQKFATLYLLKHEQGHFDITEIFSCELKESLKSYSNRKIKSEKEVKKIIQKNADALNKFQILYDKETTHSLDSVNQARWDKKIYFLLVKAKAVP